MEGREAIPYSYASSGSYYVPNRGVSVAMSVTHSSGFADPPTPGFRHGSNEVFMSSYRGAGSRIGNLNSSYQQNSDKVSSSGMAQGELAKKKRGRPRKYNPDKSPVLVLTPMSEMGARGSVAGGKKHKRGRPPGSGRKQQLASLGGWMNSSAGTAFAPYFLLLEPEEDIASKIIQLSQRRPRVLCIMSGSGTVSSVSLRHPASSNNIYTYEGHFEILRLSGSYLLSEDGSNKRTGGLSISLSSPEGNVFGGVIGGPLIAEGPVEVATCSFVYDCSKLNIKKEEPPRPLKYEQEEGEPSSTPASGRPLTAATNNWPSSQPLDLDLRNPRTGINLML